MGLGLTRLLARQSQFSDVGDLYKKIGEAQGGGVLLGGEVVAEVPGEDGRPEEGADGHEAPRAVARLAPRMRSGMATFSMAVNSASR